MTINIRKTIFIKEIITADEMGQPCDQITRVSAMAVVRNPFAGVHQEDLSPLFDVGARLGGSLTKELWACWEHPLSATAKPLLSDLRKRWNTGLPCCTPALGKPVPTAIGGGKPLMPSNHKVGALGGSIDLPLGHKDEAWSFDHIDTLTLWVPDAPRNKTLRIDQRLSSAGQRWAR